MLCKAHGIPLIWVRTTPVDDERHAARNKKFFRFAADVADYNAAADRLMKEYQVPVIDLHGFTLSLGITPLFRDHVHFPDEIQRLQGAHIAGHLACWGAMLDRRRTTAAG
jgi:hypothetical protein